MRKKATKPKSRAKPKLLLLDADIVIEAHKLDIWEALIDKYEIAVSSTVSNEAWFFKSESDGSQILINLPKFINNGEIKELEATPQEMNDTRNIFDNSFKDSLDRGELEALSIIQNGKAEDCYFCTVDKAAIQGLVMIGESHRGISLAEVLISVGLGRPLEQRLQKDYFEYWLNQGRNRFITGSGLS